MVVHIFQHETSNIIQTCCLFLMWWIAEEDDDCVIAEQVVSTCNMVSHLYGGYRPVLSDACHRHQACFICVSPFRPHSNPPARHGPYKKLIKTIVCERSKYLTKSRR